MIRTVIIIFALLLYGNLLFLQKKIDQIRTSIPEKEKPVIIFPKPSLVRALSLGHKNFVADYYWLKTIQYLGTCLEQKTDPVQLWRYAQFVTDLSPQFMEAYYYPAVIMFVYKINPKENLELLHKGRKNLPRTKELAFLLGMVYYFFEKNNEQAALNLDDAARLSGYAPYAILAARIRAEGGNPNLSQTILTELLNDPRTKPWGNSIQEMMKGIEQKKHLDFLNQSVEQYFQKYGKYPQEIEELVRAKIIEPERLPLDPFGGKYYIDPESHQVKSTKEYYLGVYRPKEFQE